MQLSVRYRTTPHPPHWGSPNAPENWCEEDYLVSPYIAEYINTLSNVLYILLAVRGILHTQSSWPRIYPHIGLMLVGIFSGIYHASMRRWCQWADSLSMIYATALLTQRIFTFDKPPRSAHVITAIILVGTVGYTVAHCLLDNLAIHTVVFLAMLVVAGRKVRALIKNLPDESSVRRDVVAKAKKGEYYALAGIIVWLLDSAVCSYLRQARRAVGMPWGFLLEFHGWWHILTAIGAHISINTTDELLQLLLLSHDVADEKEKKKAA